jgi:hypothetical protein
VNAGFPLKYKAFDVRLRRKGEQTHIFDSIRKKWLVLTPEEWVRQHLLNHLVTEIKFPASTIAIEKELQLNDLKKRYDVVIFDKQLHPYLIVECKAPYISLDQQVIDQALRYNLIIKAPFVMITNGISDFIFNSENKLVDSLVYNGQD